MKARSVENYSLDDDHLGSIIRKWTTNYVVNTRRQDLNDPSLVFIRTLDPKAEQKEYLTLVSRCDRNGMVQGPVLHSVQSDTPEAAGETHASIVRTLAAGGSVGGAS